MACGSDSSSSPSDPVPQTPFFAQGPDSVGIHLGADTIWVYWFGQTLVFDAKAPFPGDSMAISYRVSGSEDWKDYTTLELVNFPYKFNLVNSNSYAFEVDYQLKFMPSIGVSWVADTAFAALTERTLPPMSSSSEGSSSSAASSSSVGYSYTITSKVWQGEYVMSSSSGSYELVLNGDKTFVENRVGLAADGFCEAFHGTWSQSGNALNMNFATVYRMPKSDGLCPGYMGVATDWVQEITYQIYFLDAQGDQVHLVVPSLEPMNLNAPERQ